MARLAKALLLTGLVLGASILSFIPQRVTAATPASNWDTGMTFDISSATGTPSTITCASISHCISNVTFGASFYYDKSISTASRVNFTNSAYSASTATGVGNMGAAANGGQCSVTGESSSSVTFTLKAVAAATVYCYFWYPSGFTTYQVISQGATVPSSSFVAQSGTISTCQAPCVYDSGSYTEAKVAYSSPTTVEFDIKSTAGGGGGGGGGFFIGGGGTTTTTTSVTSTVYQAPTTGDQSQLLVGLAVVGGLILIVVGNIVLEGGSKTGGRGKGSQPKAKKGGPLW